MACLLCGLGVKRAAPLQPPMAPIIGAAGARGIKTRRLPLDSASRGQTERCDSRGRAVSGCLLKWIASSVGSISTIALLLQLTVTRTCTRCFEDARYPPRHSMPAALLLLMAAPRTPSPHEIGVPLETPAARTDECRWPQAGAHTRVRARRRRQPQGLGRSRPGLEFRGRLGGRAGVRHSERQDVKLGKGGVAQNLRKRTQSLR